MANANLPPEPVRRDPARRRSDNAGNLTRLNDADKNYVYCLVSLKAEEFGVDYYEQLGYEKCVRKEGAPYVASAPNASKPGEHVLYRGHVLMRIKKALHEALDRDGPDGETGQRFVDQLEGRFVDRNLVAGEDPMRGIVASRNPYFKSVNETTGLTPEI